MKGTGTLTFENNVTPRPPSMPTLLAGIQTVEGRVTVNFDSPGLRDWYIRETRRNMRVILRIARPHMPKRMFQRLRGRLKAGWRDER